MRILITGGAGFVGAAMARRFRQRDPNAEIVCLDNLKRRGSELNLPQFKQENIRFVHGDVRSIDDLNALDGNFDLMLEASAEPSVLAGLDGSASYLLQTNLMGTLNCLEFARKRVGHTIFLSTSRVYSIAPLRSIALKETETRFEIDADANPMVGLSAHGIAETFATDQPRSLYGASKLASELFVQEYADTYGLSCVVNRCGVIAGRGQFGKVDQGVFTLWVANHYFNKPLSYTGFGAQGKQVRDLMHPDDLFAALEAELELISSLKGAVLNLGGGRACSVSLKEMTSLCAEAVGREIRIAGVQATSPVDIPLYIADTRKAETVLNWKPKRTPKDIVTDIATWIRANEDSLKPLFG